MYNVIIEQITLQYSLNRDLKDVTDINYLKILFLNVYICFVTKLTARYQLITKYGKPITTAQNSFIF